MKTILQLAFGLLVGFALAILAGGCTTFRSGEMRYSNTIFDKRVAELTYETTRPDGTRTKATLKGVTSGLNADAMKAIAEGAAGK